MIYPMLPDVETMVVAFLHARLTPPVSTRVPATRPASFVRVWRTGGAALNRVMEQAQITVQAWGATAADTTTASDLASQCRAYLFNEYTAMGLVRAVEETSGVYADPDPASGVARYTFTVSLNVRAHR